MWILVNEISVGGHGDSSNFTTLSTDSSGWATLNLYFDSKELAEKYDKENKLNSKPLKLNSYNENKVKTIG